MGRFTRFLGLGEKAAHEAGVIAHQAGHVEPGIVDEGAKIAAKSDKPRVTLAEAQQAKADRIAADALQAKRLDGKAPTIESLDALTPGRFGRPEIDARLAKLTETAKEHGLIDDKLVREKGKVLKAKEAEEALRNGQPITSNEMSALQAKKQADFDKWEVAATDKAIKDQKKANGTKTIWDRLGTAALWTTGIGATAIAIHSTGVLDETRAGKIVNNKLDSLSANTAATSQRAKLSAVEAEKLNCFQVTGGRFDDKTAECISPAFGKGYNNLTTLFMDAQGWKASELKYLNAMGQKIEQIDAEYTDKTTEKGRNAYQVALAKGHSDVVKQFKENFTIKKDDAPDIQKKKQDDAPDIQKVDVNISKVMGWTYSERAPGQ